jgi:hypothetical protein
MSISTMVKIESVFIAKVKTRLMIGIFIFLTWSLTGIIVRPSANGAIQLFVYSLAEVLIIIWRIRNHSPANSNCPIGAEPGVSLISMP